MACDRDGHIVIWNITTKEIEMEQQVDYKILKAAWVPRLPSLFYVTDESGGLHMYTTCEEEVLRIQQRCAPKWQTNPVCIDMRSDNL